jgi:hypothetical protein
MQAPLFFGEAGVMAYLPAKKVAIAIALTFGEGAFDEEGGYSNVGTSIFRAFGALLAPGDPPPGAP